MDAQQYPRLTRFVNSALRTILWLVLQLGVFVILAILGLAFIGSPIALLALWIPFAAMFTAAAFLAVLTTLDAILAAIERQPEQIAAAIRSAAKSTKTAVVAAPVTAPSPPKPTVDPRDAWDVPIVVPPEFAGTDDSGERAELIRAQNRSRK